MKAIDWYLIADSLDDLGRAMATAGRLLGESFKTLRRGLETGVRVRDRRVARRLCRKHGLKFRASRSTRRPREYTLLVR